MTVSSALSRKTYAGNGVTTSFATTPVVFFDATDLVVRVTDDATGAVTALTLGTHYTVAGGGTVPAVGTVDTSGGSAPYGAPAAGTTVTIFRDVAATQETDFVQNDGSDAEASEATLDRLTMIAQRLSERLDRAVALPDGDVTGASMEIPALEDRASKTLGFDADGALTIYAPASAVTDAANVTTKASGIGAVSEDVQSVLRHTVFVTGYMSAADRAAIASGTTTNIDTAIASAHAALPSTGGEIVFPPFAGAYKLTAAPTFTKRTVLRGMGDTAVTASGTGSTRIIKDAAATAAILSLAVDGSAVQALEVVGEVGNTGDGIEIKAGRCSLRDVASYSMGGVGIRVGTSGGTENCNLWFMERVKAKSNGSHGIQIHDGSGSSDVNAGTMLHPDVQANSGDGINFGNANLNTVVGGAVQSNTGAGIRLGASAKWNTITGTDIEGNAASSDLITTSGGSGNTVIAPSLLAANCTFGEPNNRIEIQDFTSAPGGIHFPASQVASSDANTLDDYEEGNSWTPVLSFDTPGDLSITYSVQVGAYTKVGRLVTVQFTILTSAFTFTTASGSARLTGFPFTTANISGLESMGKMKWRGITKASYTEVGVRLAANANIARIVACGSGQADATLGTADFPTGGTVALAGTLTYFTA